MILGKIYSIEEQRDSLKRIGMASGGSSPPKTSIITVI